MDKETVQRYINDYYALVPLIGEKRAYDVMKNSITNDDAYSWREKEEVLAELLSLHLRCKEKDR